MSVSVIVPVYNVESYLEKCLNSLVNQALKDMEIIVVNDGSTDRSPTIIRDFVNRFPQKIKAYDKTNGGLSDARNFGLDRANGSYIGFVDSDDFVEQDMFELMLGLAQKHQAEIVICNLQKVDENGKVTQLLTQIPNMEEKIVLEDHFSIFSDLSYFACNKLFKKELFAELRFKKGMHFEDIQLIPQLLLKSTVVAQTQRYLYHYLERSQSISKSHSERGLDILRAVEDVSVAFSKSKYKNHLKELKNFQILEGVYTFLAYLAFVKDDEIYYKMSNELKVFIRDKQIKIREILTYSRFGTNYLLYLSLRKKIYYILYFTQQERLLRRLLK